VTDYSFRTLIVTAANAPLARALAAGLTPSGAGMFTAALSPSGNPPATHYVSTGPMDADLMAALASANALYAACQAAGANVPLATCQKLVAESDVSAEQAFTALDRLGLKLVQEPV
jgi:hypothetical protein